MESTARETGEESEHDFGRSLSRLYAEAGKPDLDALVALVCERLPDGRQVTVSAVRRWLRSEAAPSSLEELRALVEQLNAVVLGLGGDPYVVRPLRHWELLWLRAVPGGARRDGGGTRHNTVSGSARIEGHSVQLGHVAGDVHVQVPPPRPPQPPPAPEPAPDPAPPPGPPGPGVPPVMRVRNGQETIEFYEEGLARIWITARLRTEPDDE